MRIVTIVLAAASLVAGLAPAAMGAASAYAGQEARDVKALSPDEISGLLAGKGMGFAKAAELNGYPGPLHVLEQAAKLDLSEQQRRDTEALFASMQAKAKTLGGDLVEAERRLDRMFQDNSITADSLNEALATIGRLQAQLRSVHLAAHLAQRRILSPEQSAMYMRLQGYAGGDSHQGGHRH